MVLPERDLGSQWLPQIFTISLLCSYEEPRYEENKTVAKIGRERARYCHSSNTYCVSAAATSIIISSDSPNTSKV